MYIGRHVSTRYSCQILMKLEFSGQVFEKYLNIKFHENPSSGSRVVPCGQTDRGSDMKLTVAVKRVYTESPVRGSRETAADNLTRCLSSILIPSSLLRPGLHSGLLPLGCPTKMSAILIFPHASYMPCQSYPLRLIAVWGMIVLVFCVILHIVREARSTNRYRSLASGISTYCNFKCIKYISVKI